MLIRDNVGKQLSDSLKQVKDKDFEIVKLSTNDEFFVAIVSKIKSEIEMLEINKSVDNLAELVELIDWLQICLGMTHLDQVIEYRREKLGLYWEKYFIKDKT
jgi:predicted house-cleaning noncanonical NTP pyrophosphatase (MazG superfamily)